MGSRTVAKGLRAAVIAATIALPMVFARPAAAVSYTLDSGWTKFVFGGVGSTGTPSPYSFTAPAGGATVKVTDAFLFGDQFELFDFGSSLGLTSAPGPGGSATEDPDVAYAIPDYSKGTFLLGAGNHEITIKPVLSPFGQGGAFFRADTGIPSPVPEPATMALLTIGTLPLLRRLRRGNKGPAEETV